jgi:16S rRNA (uracil1498-N3)-methyltransferase
LVEPLFRIELTTLPVAGQKISLTGAEAKHAAAVRRMRIGEAIQLSNGQGIRVRGLVDSVDPNQVDIEVAEVIEEPMPKIQIHLAQALAKGDRAELAIQAATELGVFGVIPWQAERSISRWDGAKAAKGRDRWQTIVNEAAKQSLRVFEPVVSDPKTTKEIAGLVAGFDSVLILDPTAEAGITSQALPTAGRLLLIVGPEGGISDSELAILESFGAHRVHLGAPILRTSTAGLAAISALLASSGAWR